MADSVEGTNRMEKLGMTTLPKNFVMMAAILTASDGELDLETVTAKLQCVELSQEAVDANIAFC